MGKRTICFFNSNEAWGGGEKWHFETALWMREKGLRVIVFAYKDKELFLRSRKAGLEVYPIWLNNFSFVNPFKMMWLRNRLRSLKIDCIVLNLSADVKSAGWAARGAGIKNIVYRRGIALPVRASVINKFLFRNVLTKIVANSEDIKNKLLQNHTYLTGLNKVEIIYNGIPIANIRQSPDIKTKGKIVLGNVGRLVEQKAQYALVELAKKLKDSGYNFEIHIIGSGRLEAYLKNYSKQLGVEENIKFLGYRKELAPFYNAIDIFIMTSLHEGTSNAMLEAMGHGLPIIAFDISSMPEMVIDCKNGFLIPVGDTNILYKRTVDLITDAELRNRMGKESLELIKKQFDREIHLEKLYKLLNDKTGNLCFFNSTIAWGGGEKWHLESCTNMTKRGYRTVLFSEQRSKLKTLASQNGINCVSLKVSNLSFLNPLKVLWLKKQFQQRNVQAVIINLSHDLKLAGIAARLARVPNIVYRRGSAIPIKNRITNRLIFKNIVTHIIANSEKTKKTVLANNPNLFDSQKIKVIYNGIQVKNYKYYGLREDRPKFVIGNIGRLVYQKGQEYLVELAEELMRTSIPFVIKIAGDGPLYEPLLKLARQKGVDDKIEFVGFISDIPAFLKEIDVFVLTSRWEGFGYVMAEAMACGKPVVAFDISSNPEIVKDRETGYITPYKDIVAIKNALVDLANNEDLLLQMGSAGRDRVLENFNADKQMDKLESYLKQTIGLSIPTY